MSSPMRTGVRLALRRPGLTALELAWRLAFVLLAAALVVAAATLFLGGVQVSEADQKVLRSGIWLFMLDVALRLARDNQAQLTTAALLLLPALALLWILVAALGRRALLRRMLQPERASLLPLCGLNALRLLLGGVALVAFYGSAILAWRLATTPDDVLPEVFWRVLPALATLVLVLWSLAAWFLWLGAMPAVAGQGTLAALAAALRLWRRDSWEFLRAGVVFSTLRLLALAAILLPAYAYVTRGMMPSRRALLAGAALLVLYLVAMAWLRVARMAVFAALWQRHAGAAGAKKPLYTAPAS